MRETMKRLFRRVILRERVCYVPMCGINVVGSPQRSWDDAMRIANRSWRAYSHSPHVKIILKSEQKYSGIYAHAMRKGASL